MVPADTHENIKEGSKKVLATRMCVDRFKCNRKEQYARIVNKSSKLTTVLVIRVKNDQKPYLQGSQIIQADTDKGRRNGMEPRNQVEGHGTHLTFPAFQAVSVLSKGFA
jgi:hypothetical protein